MQFLKATLLTGQPRTFLSRFLLKSKFFRKIKKHHHFGNIYFQLLSNHRVHTIGTIPYTLIFVYTTKSSKKKPRDVQINLEKCLATLNTKAQYSVIWPVLLIRIRHFMNPVYEKIRPFLQILSQNSKIVTNYAMT